MLWRRNASLAGGFAGRPVLVMCFVVCYDLPFAGISQVSCLPLFHCLCRYQDRATEHLRPNPRKKKSHDQDKKVQEASFWVRFLHLKLI